MIQTGIQQKKSVATIIVSLRCSRLFCWFVRSFCEDLKADLLNLTFLRKQHFQKNYDVGVVAVIRS